MLSYYLQSHISIWIVYLIEHQHYMSSLSATDIICHKKCINKYILEYKQGLQVKEDLEEFMSDDINEAFNKVISHLSLQE